MRVFLDFEKQIAELENKIEDLRHLSDSGGVNIADEVSKLQSKADRLLRSTYKSLTPWQKCWWHAIRSAPLPGLCGRFVGGIHHSQATVTLPTTKLSRWAREISGRSCVVVGHEKGTDTNDRVHHNFGMARPRVP